MAQAEVARRVEVSRVAVRRWADKLATGGLAALKNAPRLGRPSGLSEAQRRELTAALKAGALAQGYAAELWTLPRVGNLCATHLGQVSDFARRRLKSMQCRPTWVTAFWKQAELAF